MRNIKSILSNINIKEDYILIHSNLLIFDKFNFSIEDLWDVLHRTLGNNKTYLMPHKVHKKMPHKMHKKKIQKSNRNYV